MPWDSSEVRPGRRFRVSAARGSIGCGLSCERRSSSIPESIPAWAPGLFERLAVPRLTGSESLFEAQGALEQLLDEWGYHVQRHVFVTNSVRLSAVSVLGAGVGWLALILYPLFVLPIPGWTVACVGLGGGMLVALASHGMASGDSRTTTPAADATNLEARRGDPRLWLVAHSDSKGQHLSLRGRVIAVLVFGLGCTAVIGALGARLLGPLPWSVALPVAVLALVGGGAMSLSAPRNDSPGAVDNATGVIAALVAADVLRDRTDIGVLITDAEELGMEGARVWVGVGRSAEGFVNFDGIDSRGQFRIMEHGPGRARHELARAIAGELRGRGVEAKVGRLPPGVFVDGVVLGGGGLSGVTVSRGDWSTLGVVHTPRDLADRVDVGAAVETGRAVASVVRRALIDSAAPAP